MIKYRHILVCVLLCQGNMATAQQIRENVISSEQPAPRCLKFTAAINAARLGAPEVSIARAQLRIADSLLSQEKGTGRPNLSAYARAAEGDSGLVDGRTNTQMGLELSQRLFDFGQGRQRKKSAEARVLAAKFDAHSTRTKLGTKAGHAYISVLANRDLFSAAERRVQRYQTLLDGVDRRLDAGLITLATANSVKAEAASARADLVDRSIELDGALIDVAVLTNINWPPCHDPAKVSDIFEQLFPKEIDEERAVVNSPQLNAARARVKAAAAEYKLAQRIRRPEVVLQLVGAYQYDQLFREWRTARRIGIDVSMPLFAGGSHVGRKKEAAAEIALAQGEQDRKIREFKQSIRRTSRRVDALMELAMARHEEKIAQAAEVDAVRRQFESGVRPYQDYERAEAALAMAEIGDIEAVYQALHERLTLAALLEKLPL